MSVLFRDLPPFEKQQVIDRLTDQELVDLYFDWENWARDEQLEPKQKYDLWAIIAGRGFGKTRSGAEWTNKQARLANAEFGSLIGATASDVRDVMVDGESGILACSHPDFRPVYTPSKRLLEYPNGVKINTYSAEEPNRLRGPQQGFGWCDEVAAWRYWEAYEQYEFGLRLGENPVTCITTTPKPRKELIEVLKESGVVISKGSTLDNKANLPRKFLNKIVGKYGNTRLGRQEIYAELLDEWEGALFRRKWIDDHRINLPEIYNKALDANQYSLDELIDRFVYIVCAVDPAVTSDTGSAENGILFIGATADGHFYPFDDKSCIDSAENWTKLIINLSKRHRNDNVIAEANNGGDLIKSVFKLHSHNLKIQKVWASRGKAARAEPVTMLYEQGRVHHVGYFPELEDEMCTWDPKDKTAASPNRMDALVWGLTWLEEKFKYTDMTPKIHGKLESAKTVNVGKLQGPDF